MPACGPSTTFVKASYINAASAFLLTQRLTPGASPYIPLLPSSNHPVRPSWHQAFRPTGSCSLFVIGPSTSSSDAGLWSIDHLRQGLIHKCSQCFPAHVAVDTRGESIHITPSQHSSGNTVRLGRMSRRGDAYLRSALIEGAHAVIRQIRPDATDPYSRRIQRWVQRCGRKGAAVRLANHNLRVVWLLLKHPGMRLCSDPAQRDTEAREAAMH